MFTRLSVVSCALAMTIAATASPHGGDWGSCKEPTTTTVTALSTVTATVTTTSTAAVSTATSITIDQCNTGSIQCCNSVTHSNSTFGQAVTSLLGVNATHPNTLMGMNCSPMDSNSTEPICEASPICCENNAHGSLISIGCIIIEM
ncbi:hydrophobin family protein [Phanerochaete sordida]|uniref:Hydrophobin n=1 Tax=Phanerochaete sordida TaxID=48140 RepID=A0A9P3LFB2_9APHY|nr:hydrophobin family protein [Phanerochaete sordida]